MAFNSKMLTDNTSEWGTPQALFEAIELWCMLRFPNFRGFQLDAAGTYENTKCPEVLTPALDGLGSDWVTDTNNCPAVWLNPPYGRAISKWMKKAVREAARGCLVVCLVPAKPDTGWWHDYVLEHASHIVYIRGRVRFLSGGVNPQPINAPFPSAVVIFEPYFRHSGEECLHYGKEFPRW